MSKGLVTCPCGQARKATCAHCGRNICYEHLSYTVTGQEGALDPACMPRCDTRWWAESPVVGYAVRQATTVDEVSAFAHAARLLLRGADVEVVAAELGLSEVRVRDIARRRP